MKISFMLVKKTLICSNSILFFKQLPQMLNVKLNHQLYHKQFPSPALGNKFLVLFFLFFGVS